MTSEPPGAESSTFLAPALMCASALSLLLKRPLHSRTISTPNSFHGKFSGSGSPKTLISLPLTINAPSPSSTVPGKDHCVVSYFNR